MSIYSALKMAAPLTLAFGLVACATGSEPAVEPDQPGNSAGTETIASDNPSTLPAPTVNNTPTSSPSPTPAEVLPDLGPAPDITNQVWLNTDQPLNLEALRGKVVLIEFWTFG